jgi:membrane-bound lytic murein transglycosylase D
MTIRPESIFFLILSIGCLATPSATLAQKVNLDPHANSIGELYVQTEILRKKQIRFWGTKEILRHGFVHTPVPKRTIRRLFSGIKSQKQTRPWHLAATTKLAMLGISFTTIDTASDLSLQGGKFDIPILRAPMVNQYIDYFTGRGRNIFRTWLKRYDRYAPLMRPILKKHGVPEDLVYISMIESAFNPKAYSISAAGGFWQFIPSTARHFDLAMNTWIDERRDFVKSTEKAAIYLKQLKKKFGDWHLAWAAYNAGEGRIRRALRRYGVETYWELSNIKNAIAKETVHYVPRVIASAILGHSREKYGFTDIKSLDRLYYDQIRVEGALDLRRLAKRFDIHINRLRLLNPALRHDITPPKRSWRLRVPPGKGKKVAQWLKNLPEEKRFTYTKYKVKSGDSLWEIAKTFRTTISVIRDFNHINNVKVLRLGQTLLIPALRSTEVKTASRRRRPRTSPTKSPALSYQKTGHEKRYTVRKGDTLWRIARKYSMNVAELKRLNNKRSDNLDIGERLILRATKQTKRTSKPAQVTVKAGDTLWRIAKRHNLSVVELKTWNKLKDADRLSIGQTLRLKP